MSKRRTPGAPSRLRFMQPFDMQPAGQLRLTCCYKGLATRARAQLSSMRLPQSDLPAGRLQWFCF